MSFYSLNKTNRAKRVEQIRRDLQHELENNLQRKIVHYFSDADTYIRKAAYQSIGKIYSEQQHLNKKIISVLRRLFNDPHHHVRQTVINAAGEIGKKDFEIVQSFFDKGLLDAHHTVRNAVIGSLKKMSQKNPIPVLAWASQYLHHADPEVRREICHGIELHGRTHPQDILPLLKKLQHDSTTRVRNTLVHVLGQISYKKGCLETVIREINTWENKLLTHKAVQEILDVHHRYQAFAIYTPKQALAYIQKHFEFYSLEPEA